MLSGLVACDEMFTFLACSYYQDECDTSKKIIYYVNGYQGEMSTYKNINENFSVVKHWVQPNFRFRSGELQICNSPSLPPCLPGTAICSGSLSLSISRSLTLVPFRQPWLTPGNPPMTYYDLCMTQDDPRVTQVDPWVAQDDPWVTQDNPRMTQGDPV